MDITIATIATTHDQFDKQIKIQLPSKIKEDAIRNGWGDNRVSEACGVSEGKIEFPVYV